MQLGSDPGQMADWGAYLTYQNGPGPQALPASSRPPCFRVRLAYPALYPKLLHFAPIPICSPDFQSTKGCKGLPTTLGASESIPTSRGFGFIAGSRSASPRGSSRTDCSSSACTPVAPDGPAEPGPSLGQSGGSSPFEDYKSRGQSGLGPSPNNRLSVWELFGMFRNRGKIDEMWPRKSQDWLRVVGRLYRNLALRWQEKKCVCH